MLKTLAEDTTTERDSRTAMRRTLRVATLLLLCLALVEATVVVLGRTAASAHLVQP